MGASGLDSLTCDWSISIYFVSSFAQKDYHMALERICVCFQNYFNNYTILTTCLVSQVHCYYIINNFSLTSTLTETHNALCTSCNTIRTPYQLHYSPSRIILWGPINGKTVFFLYSSSGYKLSLSLRIISSGESF